MAEGLQYKVGLDVTAFKAGIEAVTVGFDEIEEGAKGVKKELESIKPAVRKSLDLSGLKFVLPNFGPIKLNKLDLSGLKFDSSVTSIAPTLDKITESAKRTSTALVTVGKGAAPSLAGIRPAAGSASNALFSLSQVARDLPFGFIAIQNNLPLVVDSFAQLTKSSGGVLPALKGLAGALIGPAGIGFAFSAVVSGATALIQKYGSLAAGLNAVLGLTSGVQQAQIGLNKAIDESQGAIVGETTKLQFLTSTLADNNKTQEERKNAYQTLKREYPGVIQNMTLENSLTAAGAAAIRERTAELIKYIQLKGKESAIIKLIEEATTKQLVAQREFEQQITGENQTGLDKLINATKDAFNGYGSTLISAAKETQNAKKAAGVYAKELAIVDQELNKINQSVTNFKEGPKTPQIDPNELLKAQIRSLEANLKLEEVGVIERFKIRARIIDLQEQLDKQEAEQTIKNRRALNATLAAIDKEARAKRQDNTIERETVEQGDPLSGVLNGTEEQFIRIKELLGVPLTISVNVEPFKNTLSEAELAAELFKQKVEEIMKQFSDNINSTIEAGAVAALSSLGDALGNLASGKGFSLGNVFAGIGASLKDLGKAAIQTGVQLALLKKALAFAKSNPALLIAAGVALTALGGAIQTKFSKTPGLAQGGIVPAGFPNDSFPARLTSNEAVIPLDRIDSIIGSAGGGGTLTTRVSGNDLLFIMNRTQRSQGRGG